MSLITALKNVCPEADALLASLLEGDYPAVLQSPTVLELLRGDGSYQQGEHIEEYLEKRLRLYLTEATEAEHTDRLGDVRRTLTLAEFPTLRET